MVEAAVRYVAPNVVSGYGEAADRLVRALRLGGTRVEYRGWGRREGSPSTLCSHSRDPRPDDRAAPGAPTVVHLVPESYPRVRAEVDGPLLAHTVWETDRLPTHWPALLDGVDRVIVPTEWNREVFAASGTTTPISVVPHVACDPVPGDGGVPLSIPDDAVVFYTIGGWDDRKQPGAVVRAFLDAFDADDAVALVVKTSSLRRGTPSDDWGTESQLAGTTMLEVARILRRHPRPAPVRLEVDVWPSSRIAGLHTRGDCYVSLSHGEGWDMGAFDACAYGNPVVTTGWGGQLAYLDADAAFLVDHELAPVEHKDSRSYSPDQRWAMASHDHAVELLREVARDLGAARRRAAPLRPAVLDQYSGARVVEVLREAVPEVELAPSAPIARRAPVPRIPRTAHFIFGLRPEPEPFHLVHELAIRSCLEMVRPDAVHLHCHHEPFGQSWERIRSEVTLHHVTPVAAVRDFAYTDRWVAHYSYAHHADFVRLDVLAEHGGLYVDVDTLFVAPVPDELWDAPFVIGKEADVADPHTGAARPALSNAILLSEPRSPFVETWRDEIALALDGTWSAHSCFLAYDLAERLPAEVRVEPQRTFHAFEPTAAGIALMLEQPAPDLDGVVSMHLAAHLWWDEQRRDFSNVHAGVIDEAWIRRAHATYATVARRYLA